MPGTLKPEAARVPDPIALPLPVDDRNPAIFRAVQPPPALRTPRVTPLQPQLLSNILWSTWGANRRDDRNARREIDLFLLCEQSAYYYHARGNQLQPLMVNDSGNEDAAAAVPANAAVETMHIVYVATLSPARADTSARELAEPQLREGYYCADTGAFAGKVYLFASAHGISAVPEPCDRAHLSQRLGLRSEQHVLFAQSIRCPRSASGVRGRVA